MVRHAARLGAGLRGTHDDVARARLHDSRTERAITTDVPRVRAEGRVVHSGRQLATADARLVGPDGKLYAHATTTCLVFELPGAPRK